MVRRVDPQPHHPFIETIQDNRNDWFTVPGPGGSPAPVVCKVYSLHRQMGLATRPSAPAATATVSLLVLSPAAARTRRRRCCWETPTRPTP